MLTLQLSIGIKKRGAGGWGAGHWSTGGCHLQGATMVNVQKVVVYCCHYTGNCWQLLARDGEIVGDQSDCNWWNGEEGGGWMLVKTDVPCQREGSWQLMENNGRGVGRCFLGAVCSRLPRGWVTPVHCTLFSFGDSEFFSSHSNGIKS